MQIRDTTRRHGGGLGSPVPPPGPAEEQEDYLLATCTCPAVTLARAPTTNLPSPELIMRQSANLEQPSEAELLRGRGSAQFMQSEAYSS